MDCVLTTARLSTFNLPWYAPCLSATWRQVTIEFVLIIPTGCPVSAMAEKAVVPTERFSPVGSRRRWGAGPQRLRHSESSKQLHGFGDDYRISHLGLYPVGAGRRTLWLCHADADSISRDSRHAGRSRCDRPGQDRHGQDGRLCAAILHRLEPGGNAVPEPDQMAAGSAATQQRGVDVVDLAQGACSTSSSAGAGPTRWGTVVLDDEADEMLKTPEAVGISGPF